MQSMSCKVKVLNAIKANERGLTKSQLANRTRFLKKKERNEILEDLIEAGQIEYVQVKSDTKINYVYRSR